MPIYFKTAVNENCSFLFGLFYPIFKNKFKISFMPDESNLNIVLNLDLHIAVIHLIASLHQIIIKFKDQSVGNLI